jgi:hypothetical protein
MSEHDLDTPDTGTYDTGLDTPADDAALSEPVQQTFDVDGNGRIDVLLTRFADGAWTTLSDENADGAAETLLADLDADGVPELAVERLPDGTYMMRADTDGDGVFDQEETVTREQLEARVPGVVAYLDTHFGSASEQTVDPVADPATDGVVVDGAIVGDPLGDAEHWFNQARNGFCVPASIAQIVSEYSGVHFADESEFVKLASEQGLFSVDMDGVPGMTPENSLTLLESAGVPAELQLGTTDDLLQYLGEGRRILLFVDSGEIWDGEQVEDDRFDHAVVLTGIDVERGVAILSDPGSPDGNLEEVPLAVFEDAWADSDHTMLVCDEPPAAEQTVTTGVGDATGAAGATEQATSWMVQQPWVLLPIAVAAQALEAGAALPAGPA